MSEIKELKDKLETLQNQYEIAIRDLQYTRGQKEELEKKIESLKSENDELKHLNRVHDYSMQDMNSTTLSNAYIIEFLCREKFEKNEKIEFAAIKSYRNGWEFMYLNGNQIKPNKTDNVTIYADSGEPVSVDISLR